MGGRQAKATSTNNLLEFQSKIESAKNSGHYLKMERYILPETPSLYPAQPGECLWSQFSFKSSAGTAPVKLHILIDHRLQTESRLKRLMRVPGVLFSKRIVFRQL
jgi:hypothetical protein